MFLIKSRNLRTPLRSRSSQSQMVSLCKPARRSELKTLRLMRGRGALQKQIQEEGTIQVLPLLPRRTSTSKLRCSCGRWRRQQQRHAQESWCLPQPSHRPAWVPLRPGCQLRTHARTHTPACARVLAGGTGGGVLRFPTCCVSETFPTCCVWGSGAGGAGGVRADGARGLHLRAGPPQHTLGAAQGPHHAPRPPDGQTLVKRWSNAGQTLVKLWSNARQFLANFWSNAGQGP